MWLQHSYVAQKELEQTRRIELLSAPITLSGRKEFAERSIAIDPQILSERDTMKITYDLHGLCLLPGDASAIYFQDITDKKYQVSLATYGKKCKDGSQTVTIPLADFGDLTARQIIELHLAFWYPTTFTIDITSITLEQQVLGASTKRTLRLHRLAKSPTPIPTLLLSPTPLPSILPTSTPSIGTAKQSWPIQSVSSMKETKDKVCSQDTAAFIQRWIDTAKDLGANYIAVETPYDNPSCGDAVAYTNAWVTAVHANNLHVWHRHMPLAFEGIYSTAKDPNKNYISQITDYIKANPSFFQPGDIFSPIPEPQNGGISGVTYCSDSTCVFHSAAQFNQWLRDAMTASTQAFQTIGLGGKIKIGYFGFDGFVAWGDNNPDWHGILEDATIKQMGNITIDHYPEAVGDTMQNDLHELQTRYPNIPIIIGEWGTITGGNVEQQVRDTMTAAKHPGVIGFNYWHLGMGGNESLINDDFSHKIQFSDVQSFYLGLR